jgi:hypothetical protein
MNYLTDPDFDKKVKTFFDFLTDQQKILLAIVDEGPEEFSPEAVFGEIDKDEIK